MVDSRTPTRLFYPTVDMKILIAEDQARMQFALSALLQREENWELVGFVEDSLALLALLPTVQPDILLLDDMLPGMAVESLIPAIHGACPQVRILLISAVPEFRPRAVKLGVDAFISKIDSPRKILEELGAVASEIDSGE